MATTNLNTDKNQFKSRAFVSSIRFQAVLMIQLSAQAQGRSQLSLRQNSPNY